ncbi:hypothetical protein E1B28_000009 [Marasmius oreades]|uniref:Uncharacterized protein n=1 Tax=Marasmius oreades TaxID=181124 RepID=A0A9P7V0G8_9AGAR|nr:uncharacterized protein E1B28_000009 [Marasmius oreades]KAG7098033.1 hypothetical protein E1B28_000009 [Marasmius oreades]
MRDTRDGEAVRGGTVAVFAVVASPFVDTVVKEPSHNLDYRKVDDLDDHHSSSNVPSLQLSHLAVDVKPHKLILTLLEVSPRSPALF